MKTARKKYLMSTIKAQFPMEALIWIAALIFLAYNVPLVRADFTLCPFSLLGFDYCLGCGLGRAISLAFQGKIQASFYAHPLGIFAILVLSYRAVDLIIQANKKTEN